MKESHYFRRWLFFCCLVNKILIPWNSRSLKFEVFMDLLQEFRCYPRNRAQAYLVKKGVADWVAECAASTDILTSGITYKPATAGEHAIVLPVLDADGECIDLAAYLPANPLKWWLRTGKGLFLGHENLDSAIVYQKPIEALPSPCAWLKNEFKGCVPLTTDAMAMFMGCAEIIAEQSLYDNIIKQIALSYPTPRLSVAK